MTQTEASYHRVPDEARSPRRRVAQSLERFANITFRGPGKLLAAWDT